MVGSQVAPQDGINTHMVDRDDDILNGDGCEHDEEPFLERWPDEEV